MPRFALPLLLLPLAPCAPAQILADCEISLQEKEFGRFTVQFDHYNSPHAAANFIRLAEGLVPWLDGAAGHLAGITLGDTDGARTGLPPGSGLVELQGLADAASSSTAFVLGLAPELGDRGLQLAQDAVQAFLY